MSFAQLSVWLWIVCFFAFIVFGVLRLISNNVKIELVFWVVTALMFLTEIVICTVPVADTGIGTRIAAGILCAALVAYSIRMICLCARLLREQKQQIP